MVVRMTMVAGPVTASASPMVVSLVVVKAGLMVVMMATVSQGRASELSRR